VSFWNIIQRVVVTPYWRLTFWENLSVVS